MSQKRNYGNPGLSAERGRCHKVRISAALSSSAIPERKSNHLLTARRLSFVLRSVVSAALITFVVRKLDWAELFRILGHLHAGWAFAGCAITSCLVLGLAIRWRIFLRAEGIDLPFRTIVSLTWAGQFFNSALPGSTGGDVVKIYQVCRLAPDHKAAAAATVLVDRVTALVALLVFAGVGLAINPLALRLLPIDLFSNRKMVFSLLLAFLLALSVIWLLLRRTRNTIWGGRLRRTLAAARRGLILDWRWATAFFLALAMHLLTITIAWLFARALGLSITYLQVFLIVPVTAVIVMLPLTINGHGLRELLVIAYFTQMNIILANRYQAGVRETAIAFSLLVVTNDLLWSLPGGIWYLIRFKSPRQEKPRSS